MDCSRTVMTQFGVWRGRTRSRPNSARAKRSLLGSILTRRRFQVLLCLIFPQNSHHLESFSTLEIKPKQLKGTFQAIMNDDDDKSTHGSRRTVSIGRLKHTNLSFSVIISSLNIGELRIIMTIDSNLLMLRVLTNRSPHVLHHRPHILPDYH